MTNELDSQLSLVFSLYESVERKGPGSAASTRQALGMLGELPACPTIVEFGCGAGVATIVLARAIQGRITAVDLHQPFLDALETRSHREGLQARITTLQGDMGDPPFPDGSLDVVWSEGAIYNIGFESGLRRWRRLLRTGGCVAVTEATWLTNSPPRPVREFWDAEYPAMTSIEENLRKLTVAGFEPIGHFVLPASDWEDYYRPLEALLPRFQQSHPDDVAAARLIDSVRREIGIWREFGDVFGYVFFVGRAV